MTRRILEAGLIVLIVVVLFTVPRRLGRQSRPIDLPPVPTADRSQPLLPEAIPPSRHELGDQSFVLDQRLSRDAIAPIYDPRFVRAAEAPYDDNELVIGVEIGGEAKAYAIGPLNRREMVNDTLGGVPILVTW